MTEPRLIAFYLPQYHPVPENDEWWGKGFTEWTNVAKAKPLFKGHYQPHIPADLGFYDLRVPEVRQAQADLAREHGIEGFCYWHYWFAGKQLLERPFREVLESGEPDFPFCLAWANQSWSGVWHGAPEKILIEQTYPGEEDHRAHFNALLPAFLDQRYLQVEGKPIFVVFRPHLLPNINKFVTLWQYLAKKNGLKGIYFMGIRESYWNYQDYDFDGLILNNFSINLQKIRQKRNLNFSVLFRKLMQVFHRERLKFKKHSPSIYSYRDFVEFELPIIDPQKDVYPTIIPNWDNTPRTEVNGIVLQNSNPELFKIQLIKALDQVQFRSNDKRLVFIKSWNEWAEGNYLEPDLRYGKAYLEAIKDVLNSKNL